MVIKWIDDRCDALLTEMVMALIARIYGFESGERRRMPRYPIAADATLRGPDGAPLDVLVYDLSMTGFRMETPVPLDLESTIWIGLAGIRAEVMLVARRGPTGYGCEFVVPITFYQLSDMLNPQPVVVALGQRDSGEPPQPTGWRDRMAAFRARLAWERLLFAAVAAAAFLLSVLSLWPR